MINSDILIIFVKYPTPGLVKTRLAKSIGDKKAAALYRLFVEVILKRTNAKSFTRIIFYTPVKKEERMRAWLGKKLEMFPQRGRNLGLKLTDAFAFAFKRGARRVIAIGTDSPTLNKDLITKAFSKLKKVECVIGPALDGGYYLIGLSHFNPGIFRGVRWGTNKVLEKTQDKLQKFGLEYMFLNPEPDIDSFEDLCLFKQRLSANNRTNSLGLSYFVNMC